MCESKDHMNKGCGCANDAASGKMEEGKHKMKDACERGKEAVKDMAESVSDKAKSMMDKDKHLVPAAVEASRFPFFLPCAG